MRYLQKAIKKKKENRNIEIRKEKKRNKPTNLIFLGIFETKYSLTVHREKNNKNSKITI